MEVTQAVNDGLKRELSIRLSNSELDSHLAQRFSELQKTAQIKGFRPGKVPIAHLRRIYAKSTMSEVIEQLVSESSEKAIADSKETPITQPEITIDQEGQNLPEVFAGKSEFNFKITFEVMPTFELASFDDIELVHKVVEVSDQDIDEEVGDLVKRNRPYVVVSQDDVEVKDQDMVTLSFYGTIDGKPFEGNSGDDSKLVIGSSTLIPGFEDQLIGAKIGQKLTVKVTFPEDYPEKDVAGKPAEFAVEIKGLEHPGELPDEDTLAQGFGCKDGKELRERLKTRKAEQNANHSQSVLKRALLDELDQRHDFELPSGLVKNEFDGIWRRVMAELERNNETFEQQGTTEQEVRRDYQKIAERRVRLGLVLRLIGENNAIEVSQSEVFKKISDEAGRFSGQASDFVDYYRKTPGAISQKRATMLEDKVIDLLLGKITVKEQKVTKDQLFLEDGQE